MSSRNHNQGDVGRRDIPKMLGAAGATNTLSLGAAALADEPVERLGLPPQSQDVLSKRQQNLPENNSIVVHFVVSCVNKCHRTFEGQVAQSIKFFAMFLDLRGISPPKFLPTGWVVPEPFPQLGAWRQFLRPIINCRIGFLDPSRPQSIDQYTLAVVSRRALICAL